MSIYDIDLKSVDGQEDFLKNFKGKVSLIINVTGDCGNAPQYAVIETLYKKYKDQGFEVIAVPTNDYCGVGLTYGEHVYGTETASSAQEFAKEKYGVTYQFSELIESNTTKNDIIPGLPSKFGQITPHKLYKTLGDEANELQKIDSSFGTGGGTMAGNFEKYLVNKEGKLIRHYPNGALLNYAPNVPKADIAYISICKDIEKALAE
jgi:glutathione peroxidase